MESESAFDIGKLKDLNTKLFDLQARSLLCDSIIKELESKIAITNVEVQGLQTTKAGIKDRQSDLDLAIKTKMDTYDELLGTKMQIEFFNSFLNDDASARNENRAATKHVYLLNDEARNIQRVHEKNSLVQEINKIKLKIARFEREIKKYDDNLIKLQLEQAQEFQSLTDRRNKVIVSIILLWKERQIVEARVNQNNLKIMQLDEEDQDLTDKLEQLEREELSLWRTGLRAGEVLPILSDLPVFHYEETAVINHQFSPDKKSSVTSSQEKSFEKVEKSPKVGKLDTKKNQATKKVGKAEAGTPIAAPNKAMVKICPSRVIKTRSKASNEASSKAVIDDTHKMEEVEAQKSPPMPDVIDSTPNSPVRSIKGPNQDQSIMDLDEEFETFASVASSPEPVPSADGDVDDVDGSFFGGGPSADGDNWF